MAQPTVTIGALSRPDGSASYSFNGYSVTAAVNGPVEAQRRDELPDEAAIDVTVRPTSGVGAIRERYLESLIHGVLHRTILTKAHPRTLIQVTLQVTSTLPAHTHSGKISPASLNLMLLPSLLNAALLGLMSTSLPLRTTYGATGMVVDSDDRLQLEPTAKQVAEAVSTHVLCFSADGSLLLFMTEGLVSVENLPLVERHARLACLGTAQSTDASSDTEMDTSDADMSVSGVAGFIRNTILSRLKEREAWRTGAD